MVTIIDRSTDSTGEKSTADSTYGTNWSLDDPIDRFGFIIQRLRFRSYDRKISGGNESRKNKLT